MTEYIFQANINKFEPELFRYSGEKALFLADCAKLAYEPKDACRRIMQDQLGFRQFQFFSGSSTQAFIAGNQTIIIVCFRGTEMKLKDFLRDARLLPERGPAGKVHRGFYAGLAEVWGEKDSNAGMHQVIKQYQNNNQAIWFCGHSLGAALATLAAAEYVLKGNKHDMESVKGIYTIGQPRVGDDDFAESYDAILGEKSFRFVNNNDVVTQVPPPDFILNFTHVGQQMYIDSKGHLHDSIAWWKKIWDRFRGIRKDIGDFGMDALEDHSSEEYVKLIKANRSVITKWS